MAGACARVGRRAARLLGGLLLLLSASAAIAAERFALVIGNAAYGSVPALANSVQDARAVAGRLQEIGFKTTVALDATRLDMVVAIQNFLDGVKGGDEVIVYYAGHGVEVGGANYMLPVDVPPLRAGQERLLRTEGINLNDLMSDLDERKARVSVLILDACRDNPFPRAGSRSLGAQRGLAQAQPPEGVFVMYSAGPGQAALDNLGPADRNPNGVFTRVLLEWMGRENIELRAMAIRMRDEVQKLAREAGHQQRPGYYDGMNGDFFFRAAAVATTQPAARPPQAPSPAPAATPAAPQIAVPPVQPAPRPLQPPPPMPTPPQQSAAAPPTSVVAPYNASEQGYIEPRWRETIKQLTDGKPTWSLAANEKGGHWWLSFHAGDQATRDLNALASCEFQAGSPCFIQARNGQFVAPRSGPQQGVAALLESGPFDAAKVPVIRLGDFGRMENYRRTMGTKAMALHPNTAFGISYAADAHEAQRLALQACNDQARTAWNRACMLYAIGNDVVLHRRATSPIR